MPVRMVVVRRARRDRHQKNPHQAAEDVEARLQRRAQNRQRARANRDHVLRDHDDDVEAKHDEQHPAQDGGSDYRGRRGARALSRLAHVNNLPDTPMIGQRSAGTS